MELLALCGLGLMSLASLLTFANPLIPANQRNCKTNKNPLKCDDCPIRGICLARYCDKMRGVAS